MEYTRIISQPLLAEIPAWLYNHPLPPSHLMIYLQHLVFKHLFYMHTSTWDDPPLEHFKIQQNNQKEKLNDSRGESKNPFIKFDMTLINYRDLLENLMDLKKVLLENLAHRWIWKFSVTCSLYQSMLRSPWEASVRCPIQTSLDFCEFFKDLGNETYLFKYLRSSRLKQPLRSSELETRWAGLPLSCLLCVYPLRALFWHWSSST